jgi:hypothetical protein
MNDMTSDHVPEPDNVHFHPVHEPGAYMGEYMMFLSVKR